MSELWSRIRKWWPGGDGEEEEPADGLLGVAAVEERAGSEVQWFVVEPGKMYPRALEDLERTVEAAMAGVDLGELGVQGALRMYVVKAQRVPARGWALARVPRDGVVEAEAVVLRAEALELARLWFTEKLHQSIGQAPMGLHIVQDSDWRL